MLSCSQIISDDIIYYILKLIALMLIPRPAFQLVPLIGKVDP